MLCCKQEASSSVDLARNLNSSKFSSRARSAEDVISINSTLEEVTDDQEQEFSDIFPFDSFFNYFISITEEYALKQALNLNNLITNQIFHSFTNYIEKNGDEVLETFLYQLQSSNKSIAAISLHIITQLSVSTNAMSQ